MTTTTATQSKLITRSVLTLLLVLNVASHSVAGQRPVDYANPLVGTAPLDDPELIGNAPPPGEEIYTGFTSPGPAWPHGEVNLTRSIKTWSMPPGIMGSFSLTLIRAGPWSAFPA